MLKRTLSKYVPMGKTVFNPSGKLLLFEYHDDRAFKEAIFISTGLSAWFSISFLLSQASYLPIYGFALTSISAFSVYKTSQQTVKNLSLMDDGKYIEITTFGIFKGKTYALPIADLKAIKGKTGFKVFSKGKTFLLEQEGKIYDVNLFYAVLRKLQIDSSKFTTA